MNEKTRIQIEEMKKQTIGVEIEMNTSQGKRLPNLQPAFSEQTDTSTRTEETVTAPGPHGTETEGNGNSKRM